MPLGRVIFGCGSQARYVIDNLRSRGFDAPQGLVDVEAGGTVGRVVNDVFVRWDRERALAELDPASTEVIIAHGKNELKRDLAQTLRERGFHFFSAVHERASISPSARVGEGCIVNAFAALLPNSELKAHVIVHSGAIIEHDCVLSERCNIAPGAHLAGRVRVGEDAYLYTGCVLIPGVNIGARAVVGAGAVVLEDVPDDACVVGNPARPKKKRKKAR
jgi:UDP-perosamine 4-acetyltransferase